MAVSVVPWAVMKITGRFGSRGVDFAEHVQPGRSGNCKSSTTTSGSLRGDGGQPFGRGRGRQHFHVAV